MLRTTIGLGAVALILAGCEVSFEPTPPDVRVDARASTAANLADETARTVEQLGPGEGMLVEVDVPANASDGLYLYLDEDLDLTVRNANRAAVASSSGPDSFRAGSFALSRQSETQLDPSVVAAQACPGTCVILNNPGSTQVYMDVRNSTGSTENVGVYAVLREFDDASERRSEPIRFSSNEEGALETLGDEDVFEAGRGGTLFFDAVDSPLDFRATIEDPTGIEPPRTITDEEEALIFEDDIITVHSANARAAVSSQSKYFLEILLLQ